MLFHWYRHRNRPLPSEKKSGSEFELEKGCCRILCGFNTDAKSEMNIASFSLELNGDKFGSEPI